MQKEKKDEEEGEHTSSFFLLAISRLLREAFVPSIKNKAASKLGSSFASLLPEDKTNDLFLSSLGAATARPASAVYSLSEVLSFATLFFFFGGLLLRCFSSSAAAAQQQKKTSLRNRKKKVHKRKEYKHEKLFKKETRRVKVNKNRQREGEKK